MFVYDGRSEEVELGFHNLSRFNNNLMQMPKTHFSLKLNVFLSNYNYKMKFLMGG